MMTYHAKTRDEPTHHHVHPRVHCSDLNDIADDEDDDTEAE
jgi:hypothetical protein